MMSTIAAYSLGQPLKRPCVGMRMRRRGGRGGGTGRIAAKYLVHPCGARSTARITNRDRRRADSRFQLISHR